MLVGLWAWWGSCVWAQGYAQPADHRQSARTGSWRVATLSELGCPTDGVTDATACVNGFLAKASAANPLKLVLDGTAAMQGLVISPAGNTWIEGLGWGTGIVIEAKSNQDGIRIGAYNGGYSEGQSAAPVRAASNIILSNFTIDANGSLNSTGPGLGLAAANTPLPGAPVHAVFGAVLANATGIVVDHVRFVNPPRYCLTLVNVADVTVRDSSFSSALSLQDGVHVDGPAEDIRVLNNVFATGDDGVALNAPEGYGGDISDVVVDGNIFNRAWSVGRVYTSIRSLGRTYHARRITFSHNRGTTRNTAFFLGGDGSDFFVTPDQIEDASIENNDISTPMGLAYVSMPFGLLRFVDNTYEAPTSTMPMIEIAGPNNGDLELTGNTIRRNAAGHATPPLIKLDFYNSLGRLTLDGNRVADEAGPPYAALPFLIDIAGPLGELRIDSADMTGVAALVNPATELKDVHAVSGPGVLATNTRFPDAVMADGSAYLSATGDNAGKPCVKLNGKVAPL